jgi:RimJ/RimL family protein N-acetyltransferase
MFARTPRLLLRPGFPEDAPALAAAIADKAIVMNLAGPPWPFRIRDADAYLARARDPVRPCLLIFHRTNGPPELIGECGLARRPSGAVEIGYWIARSHWSRGFASEACTALVDIARTLGLATLEGSHFVDNPASARVLEKLGFEPLGLIAPRFSCARGADVPARLMRLSLAGSAIDEDEEPSLAA